MFRSDMYHDTIFTLHITPVIDYLVIFCATCNSDGFSDIGIS